MYAWATSRRSRLCLAIQKPALWKPGGFRASACTGPPALRSTLPRPGQGTLSGRLLGLQVRAKTGTLFQQVSALSGWVRLHSGSWAAFSILSHGLAKREAVALEDRLVALITTNA